MKLRKLLSRIFSKAMENGLFRVILFAIFSIGLLQLKLGPNQSEALGMILGIMLFEALLYLIPKMTRNSNACEVSATESRS